MPRPRWRTCSAVPTDRINDDRLYRALDGLLPYDDALCRHLQDRYGNLFGATVDVLCLLYELTSAYWEGRVRGNQQARRGDSRDTRPDCPQVCIGLVTSRDGLPLAFEVFDGNRSDVTTTKYMVLTMDRKYGQADRILVMLWDGQRSEPGVSATARRPLPCRDPDVDAQKV